MGNCRNEKKRNKSVRTFQAWNDKVFLSFLHQAAWKKLDTKFTFVRYSLGTPDTKRSGLRTRNARKALTSNPSFIILVNTVLNALCWRIKWRDKKEKIAQAKVVLRNIKQIQEKCTWTKYVSLFILERLHVCVFIKTHRPGSWSQALSAYIELLFFIVLYSNSNRHGELFCAAATNK